MSPVEYSWRMTKCLLCPLEAEIEERPPVLVDFGRFEKEYLIKCKRCGKYRVSDALRFTPVIPQELKQYLSAAARQASEAGSPILLREGNLPGLAAPHRRVSVSQKVEKVLRFIAVKCEHPGVIGFLHDEDFPVADCSGWPEFNQYLEHLDAEQLIMIFRDEQGNRTDGYAPTIKGWQVVEPTLPVDSIPGRCFVAMSFHPSLDSAYEVGIKPAILECGFKPICMKEITTNEGITDRIMSEIRLAQFVVADFTGQRGGVYFEAGFARGLGRDVIWACRKDESELVHFDIKHLGRILWETPEQLREKLADSIRANIIPKR